MALPQLGQGGDGRATAEMLSSSARYTWWRGWNASCAWRVSRGRERV